MTVKSQITIVLKRVQNDTSYNKMTSYHQKYCLYNRGTFQTSDQEDEHKKSSGAKFVAGQCYVVVSGPGEVQR